jgi:adenine-specific DNA-methyltransferase
MFNLHDVLEGRSTWAAVRGDALDLLATLPPESVDTFLTDPPYGISLDLKTGQEKGRRVFKRVRNDGPLQARRLWEKAVPLCARAAKPDTAHLFFGTYKSPWMHEVLSACFTVKHCVVWIKPQWGLGWYMRPRWELAMLVHKGKPPKPWKADCDVWECSRDELTKHPCRKPVPLLRRALRTLLPAEHRQAAPAPLIVDPFAGVFSTGVAALEEGCRFVGFELDRRYVAVGDGRLKVAQTT